MKELIGISIIITWCLILTIAINSCSSSERKLCDAQGGVWLFREQVCVDGPDG